MTEQPPPRFTKITIALEGVPGAEEVVMVREDTPLKQVGR